MEPLHRNFSYQQPQGRLPSVPVANNRRRFAIIGMIVAGAAMIAISSIVIKGSVSKPDPQDNNIVVAASNGEDTPEQKTTPKKTVDTSALPGQLQTIIKQYPYDTSVSVVDINSGKLIQSGDSYPFVAASTTKLLTAIVYLNNIETGQASLNDTTNGKTVSSLLQAMVNKSDNEAWTTLNTVIGKDSLNAYAKKQGLTSYDSSRNVITSNDMALLLSKLYKGDLINQEHTKLLYSWMQNTSEEQFIPPAIPSGTTFYHKAGYLEDRAHDAAIVEINGAPFVIVIYSKTYGNAKYDFASGSKLFKDAVTTTLTTFNK